MQPLPTVPTNAVHNLRRSAVLAAALGALSLLVTALAILLFA